MKILWKASAVAVLVVAGGVVAVPAYAADLSCAADLGDVTVDGNLTVASGTECVLGGATVTGNIIVEPDGWLDATSVEVGGDVIATDAYGVSLDGTSVAGDISVFSVDTRVGFVYVNDLQVGGDVAAGGVDVEVTDSSIGGSLSTIEANYVDLVRTSVTGEVSIDGSAFGVTVAGAIVSGSVSVSGSSRDVLIGANADGTADAFGNTIGGGLTLSDNTANLRVAGTSVFGALTLSGNDPVAALGAGNTAGSLVGDHTGDAPGTPPAGDQAIAVTVPTQSSGELSWSLDGTSALVDLGVAEEQLEYFEAHGEIVPIRVQDTRPGEPAWSVTAQVSDFAAGGESVSSEYLGWRPTLTENEGGAAAGPAVPSGFEQGDGLSVARTLAFAPTGHARGAVVAGAELDLLLPLDTPQGTYTATVTLTALS